MSDYLFRLVNHDQTEPLADRTLLEKRPFVGIDTSFTADAHRFVPGDALETAINTAIAVGEPLLITGEPGTGKTQSAYYTAYKLGVEPLIHFQVKSDTSARDLLYHFDAVRYFHDAHLRKDGGPALDKADYVEPRALWRSFTSDHARVLLIDEIDKAPRDFPNDLLHELDQMEFVVAETQQTVSAPRARRPIVIITSNSERQLPAPFLRRCVYHHIHFDEDLLRQAIESHGDNYANLSTGARNRAEQHFQSLRGRSLRKPPSTSEFLVWLEVLALAGIDAHKLDVSLSSLPYLGILLKDHKDQEEL